MVLITENSTTKQSPAQQQKQQVHAIPLSVAENASAYLYPEKIETVSMKDRARLIYTISQYAEQLRKENQALDMIAGKLNHDLVMLLTPVSDQ